MSRLKSEQELTIPRLVGVPAFVRVAELGSFRAAARSLEVTPAAVSKAVARLEEHLGTQLFFRSSRRVALTTEGALYLDHCRAALDRMTAAEEALVASRRLAKGVVRASLSRVLAEPVLRGLAKARTRHPQLMVRLSFTDREARLAEGFDVAVRIGALKDSPLVARHLHTPRWVTVASPRYLATAPPLRTPEDLKVHRCLHFSTPRGRVIDLAFPERVSSPHVLVVDDGAALVSAARHGLGVAQAFDFMVRDALRAGDLVEVLGDRDVPGPPIHALTPRGRLRVARVRVFVDLVHDALRAGDLAAGRAR